MTIGARAWTKRTMPGVRDNTYGQKYKVGSHLLCPGTPIQGLLSFPPFFLFIILLS